MPAYHLERASRGAEIDDHRVAVPGLDVGCLEGIARLEVARIVEVQVVLAGWQRETLRDRPRARRADQIDNVVSAGRRHEVSLIDHVDRTCAGDDCADRPAGQRRRPGGE